MWPTEEDIEKAWIDGETPTTGKIRKIRKALGQKRRDWVSQRDFSTLKRFIAEIVGVKVGKRSDIGAARGVSNYGGSAIRDSMNLGCFRCGSGPFSMGAGGGRRVIRSGRELS